MCTSNSGEPFNQPSKSCTKWLLVMYRPGDGGGGGTTSPIGPPPPPLQSTMHSSTRLGVCEKSVSTGTTASTGIVGGRLGSSTWRRRFARIFASASGGFDRFASEAAAGAPPSGSVTGARSAQPRAAVNAAMARIRCNMSPPGESGGSLCGEGPGIHRRFLATRPQNTRDSRAMLALAVDSTYWQQRVAYEIVASVDEPSGVLSGHVRITYVNQSPDTLRDFSVHQYLNAFRPGSRWAAADSAEQRVRFQHMQDPDYAFERITTATVMGERRAPDYPYAPDSTIAHWRLPQPLAPGDSLVADIAWQARPSTLPRRQGRRGRRFDFAQWYPKVVVYDRYGWEAHPLYPAGEFYGEFATYDVTLDLAADQVIGATGVPVCGDPGWRPERANLLTAVTYQREFYHQGPALSDCPAAAAGRKTVRFRADRKSAV